MESTTINKVIKEVRELFNELRSNLSREETKRIRNELYKKEADCNWTRTQNHLVLNRTLNHLAKLARLRTKWFWVRVQLQSINVFLIIPSIILYHVFS